MRLPLLPRFGVVPYPLWRRRLPAPVRALAQPLFRRFLAAGADLNPPQTPDAMVGYLTRWGLLDGATPAQMRAALESSTTPVEVAADTPAQPYDGPAVRLPAQWEPMEAVILTWPVFYPSLWEAHAQMVEAISAVADVHLLAPSRLWAQTACVWLARRGQAQMARVRPLVLPTDDIWVRDYGPIVGLDADGRQVALDAIFDPLPNYPQTRDDAMPTRWAAHHEIPAHPLALHIEGGNVWSDGAGTLLMSDDLLERHPDLNRDEVERRLRAAIAFDKLIITPHLALEETHHVDLLTKLADARTVLVAAPTNAINRRRLLDAANRLSSETNAQGERYRVIPLPMPPPVLNWGAFGIWRSYTNALTVNGRVLVPVYGVPTDAEALDIYRRTMPDHEIVPIDCAQSAYGGGAVHCLTKEVPASRRP